MKQISKTFTNDELTQIVVGRRKGTTYSDIADEIGTDASIESLRRAYNNYHTLFNDKGKLAATFFSAAIDGNKAVKTALPVPTKRDETKADNARILVISDMHVPYHHPDMVAFLTALKTKYKFTRSVCIGDEVDHHAMSFHDSDPDLMSAGHELQASIKALQPLYKLFPDMDLVDSNHGSLLYRKGLHHGIARKYLRDYGEVLNAPKGWIWQNELMIDLPGGNRCFFHHGLSKDVMKVVALRGVCVVQGHYHTEFRIGYIGNPATLLWGMATGCLIDRRAMAFAYDNANLGRPVIGTGCIIDGQPRLLPMILGKDHRWTGIVP